ASPPRHRAPTSPRCSQARGAFPAPHGPGIPDSGFGSRPHGGEHGRAATIHPLPESPSAPSRGIGVSRGIGRAGRQPGSPRSGPAPPPPAAERDCLRVHFIRTPKPRNAVLEELYRLLGE